MCKDRDGCVYVDQKEKTPCLFMMFPLGLVPNVHSGFSFECVYGYVMLGCLVFAKNRKFCVFVCIIVTSLVRLFLLFDPVHDLFLLSSHGLAL